MRPTRRRGAALMVALVTLLIVMLMSAAVLHWLLAARRQARYSGQEQQAQALAEAGLARAAAQLAANSKYAGETWRVSIGKNESAESTGIVQIDVPPTASSAAARQIKIMAQFPDHPWRRAVVTIEQPLAAEPK